MNSEHKVQPPEQALDDRHSFTEEQYFRHRYHNDPVFRRMYDRAHAEVEAMKSAGQPGQPPVAGQGAEQFSRADALVATMFAQEDPQFAINPEGAYARAVERVKANRTATHPAARFYYR